MNKFSWRWISCNVVNSTKAFITPNLDYNLPHHQSMMRNHA